MGGHLFTGVLCRIGSHTPTYGANQTEEDRSFIHYLIHSFNTYLLCTYCVPGTVLGTSNPVATKVDKILNYLQAAFMAWTSRMCDKTNVDCEHEQSFPGAESAKEAMK